MSVEANKALIRRLNDEVINGGRLEVIDEVLSPQLKHSRTALGTSARMLRPGAGWAADASALETFKAATRALRAAFPDWESIIDEQVGEGDTVVTRYTVRGTQKSAYLGREPSGDGRMEFVETVFARIVDGKVSEFWGLGDELGFLKGMGVSLDVGATA